MYDFTTIFILVRINTQLYILVCRAEVTVSYSVVQAQ